MWCSGSSQLVRLCNGGDYIQPSDRHRQILFILICAVYRGIYLITLDNTILKILCVCLAIQESLLLQIQKSFVNDFLFSKPVWRHYGSQTFHRFQDVVYLCAANSTLEPQSCIRHRQRSVMLAFAGSTTCREQMDCPGIFPDCILSLPTPAFDKIVPLSHSVTLICHFL